MDSLNQTRGCCSPSAKWDDSLDSVAVDVTFSTSLFNACLLALVTSTIATFLYHIWKAQQKIAFIDWVRQYKLRKAANACSLADGKRPPTVGGHWFWGSALDLSEDAASFLQRVAKEYGDVAMIRLINRKVAVLTDIHSFSNFCHEVKFDFRPIINQVNRNVFGFSVAAVDQHRKRLVSLYRTARVSETVTLFDSHLNRTLDGRAPRATDISVHDFAVETGFLAVFQTLLGTNQQRGDEEAVEFYSNYSKFAKYFNHLWLGLPLRLFPSAQRAFANMFVMHPSLDQVAARADVCPYLALACKLMRDNGHADEDIVRHSIELIHVHANIVRVAYWMLVFALSAAEASQALVEELDQVVAQKKAVCPDGDDAESLLFDLEEIDSLPCLQSVFMETVRLTSGVVVIRAVTQDTLFKVASGDVYRLDRGDTAFFFPPAHHRDPEIFERPSQFVWDRFLLGTSFYKNGKVIDKPVLGFGSLCIGQRFATVLAKWYVIQMFQRWHMRLTGPVPSLDDSYQGHEILPPKGDTTFCYEPRPGAIKLGITGPS